MCQMRESTLLQLPALIISERMVNMPPALLPNLLDSLLQETRHTTLVAASHSSHSYLTDANRILSGPLQTRPRMSVLHSASTSFFSLLRPAPWIAALQQSVTHSLASSGGCSHPDAVDKHRRQRRARHTGGEEAQESCRGGPRTQSHGFTFFMATLE